MLAGTCLIPRFTCTAHCVFWAGVGRALVPFPIRVECTLFVISTVLQPTVPN